MSLVSGWRVPLRVARRDALRSRGRSALIVAMIAVPVLGIGAIDVLVRTAQVDSHERVPLELGSKADAWIRLPAESGPVDQSIDTRKWGSQAQAQPEGTSLPAVTPVSALLPPGSRVATIGSSVVNVSDPGAAMDGLTVAVVGDVRDPLVGGRYHFSGSAPDTTDELLATASFLRSQHLRVGSTVDLVNTGSTTPRTYRVVGELHDPNVGPGVREVMGLPGTFAYAGDDLDLVTVPGGMTWSRVLALNAKGYLVFSRQVVAHPPKPSAVPYNANDSSGPLSVDTLFAILLGILVVGLAMLEVCLLAGAAFAVGVRRQTRTVGLLAAAGSDARGIRRMVLGQGLVLGCVAAAVGVPVAVFLAGASLPLFRRLTPTSVSGPFDLRPLELFGIGAIAVVAGLAAAAIPARTASRMDPVRALAGRRGQASSPKRWPFIGLGLAGLGALLSVAGAARAVSLYRSATGQSSSVYGAATMLLIGAALVQIGLIIAAPAIIGAAGRLATYLPLAPRLALRDAARNRGRSAPAVGAVLAAVAVSSALLMYVASQDDHDRRRYQATLLPGQGQISLMDLGPVKDGATTSPTLAVPPIREALAGTLPIKSMTVVQTLACRPDSPADCYTPTFDIPKQNQCPLEEVTDPTAVAEQERRLAGDWRCAAGGSGFSYASRLRGDPVGGPDVVTALTGAHSAAARAVLARGGVVVFQRADVADGRVTVSLEQSDGTQQQLTLPAVYVPTATPPVIQAVWSPTAAKKAGQIAEDDSLVMTFTHAPSKAELKAANAKIRALGVPFNVYVERGYKSNYGPGLLALVAGAALVTLLATGVATGLSQADARPDHATLSAVGASPRVRRTLAGAQSWSLALLGTLLGVLAGLVPAIAIVWARPGYDVVVPWGALGLTLVVIPLLAGLGALLLTRSRLPLVHRLT